MSIFTKIGEAQKFFKEAGINLESIFDLFTGKASGKKIAQTVTPLLIKVSPAIGKAIDHLEAQHHDKCYLVISKEQDEQGRPLEALSVCKINVQSGQLEFLETIPFYQVANYITDKLENNNEQKLLA
jgi:hypothetical protein